MQKLELIQGLEDAVLENINRLINRIFIEKKFNKDDIISLKVNEAQVLYLKIPGLIDFDYIALGKDKIIEIQDFLLDIFKFAEDKRLIYYYRKDEGLIKEKLVSLKSKKEESEEERKNLLKSLKREDLEKSPEKIKELYDEVNKEVDLTGIITPGAISVSQTMFMQERIKCLDEQIEELEFDLQEFEEEKKELEGIEQNQQVNINLSEQKTEQVNFKNKAQSNPQGIR